MPRSLVLAVALAAVTPGCLAGLGPDSLSIAGVEGVSFLPPVPVSREWPSAEPVIAVASDGTLFVEGVGRHAGPPAMNVNKAWRSTDGGATWTDVTPPALGEWLSNDGFVAVGNGDTVYVANVFMLTFQLFRSSDMGGSWEALPAARLPALMHRHWILPVGDSTLHLAMEALPPSFVPWLVRAPAADIPVPQNEGMWYMRSDDRGLTWTAPVQIDPVVNFAGQSNMVVDASGERLYVARFADDQDPPTYESGEWYLLASEDGGSTWERRDMFRLTSELSTAVPGLAIDETGTLYMAWTQEVDGVSRAHLASSADGGRSWTAPRVVGPPDRAQAMAWVEARAPGVVGMAWYAAGAPGLASEVDAPWFVEYAHVTAADSLAPVVRVHRVTPEAVHRGNVCAKGPACGEGEDRRLLDYPWMDFAHGRMHIAFSSTEWERPSAFAVVAVEAR